MFYLFAGSEREEWGGARDHVATSGHLFTLIQLVDVISKDGVLDWAHIANEQMKIVRSYKLSTEAVEEVHT